MVMCRKLLVTTRVCAYDRCINPLALFWTETIVWKRNSWNVEMSKQHLCFLVIRMTRNSWNWVLSSNIKFRLLSPSGSISFLFICVLIVAWVPTPKSRRPSQYAGSERIHGWGYTVRPPTHITTTWNTWALEIHKIIALLSSGPKDCTPRSQWKTRRVLCTVTREDHGDILEGLLQAYKVGPPNDS